MKLLILASLACVAMVSSAAAQPAKPQTACIWTKDLKNHTVADDGKTILWNVNNRSVYRIETAGGCLGGVTSTDPIVMRNQNGTGQICNKMDIDISIHGSRCIVTGFSKLTPEEAAALPKGIHP